MDRPIWRHMGGRSCVGGYESLTLGATKMRHCDIFSDEFYPAGAGTGA